MHLVLRICCVFYWKARWKRWLWTCCSVFISWVFISIHRSNKPTFHFFWGKTKQKPQVTFRSLYHICVESHVMFLHLTHSKASAPPGLFPMFVCRDLRDVLARLMWTFLLLWTSLCEMWSGSFWGRNLPFKDFYLRKHHKMNFTLLKGSNLL